jgi:putative Holliday junction resolvase
MMSIPGERILALDLGERRIGLAVSDELGWTAHGLPTLERVGPKKDLAKLRAVVAEYRIRKLIVGLPRNMNGSLGPQANRVLEFIEQLKNKLKLDVIPWDERLTTQAAERVLIEADLSRAKRRKKVDQVAAVLILQGYLDSQSLTQPVSRPEP